MVNFFMFDSFRGGRRAAGRVGFHGFIIAPGSYESQYGKLHKVIAPGLYKMHKSHKGRRFVTLRDFLLLNVTFICNIM